MPEAYLFSMDSSLSLLAASEHRLGLTDSQVAIKLNRTVARVKRALRLLSELRWPVGERERGAALVGAGQSPAA